MNYRLFAVVSLFALSVLACAEAGSESENKETGKQKSEETSSQGGTELDEEKYIKLGDSITKVAFQTLSGELKKAMQRGGVAEAVTYCNVNAYPLTDSVGEMYAADLMRVAEKYRNPDNALTDFDAEAFERMKAGEQKMLKLHEGDAVFYKRIDLAPQCLSCHGEPGNDIADNDYALIKEKYPDDKAVNFKPGDLRGMWKITFPDPG